MKKLIAFSLALCMIFALCACGAESVEAAPVEESVAEEAAVPAAEPLAQTTDAGGMPEKIAPEDQPVPDHAEAVDVELDPGTVYLAFAADQHAETTGFQVWLEDILGVYGDQLASLNYSGDVCDKNWDAATYEGFRTVLDTLVPGRYNVTTGNQEWKAGAPGATWAELGEGFTRIGETASTETYRVYNLGAAQETMSFPQTDIDALDAYLAEQPENVPVFVLSHFPLHLSVATASHSIPGGDHRQTENNAALIEVLNKYPNVIFLWAHNHTFQDPRYGTIRPAGSAFTYDYNNPTDKIEIGFTYVNCGSFCRGDSYGLIAGVKAAEDGVEVTLSYVDTNVPMETKDSAVITYGADGAVTAEVTDGTGIDRAEVLAMSGYADDPDFDAQF